MQIAFSLVLAFLAIFIYWSNPKEKVNIWCCLATIFFFLGVFKQAILYDIIPTIQIIFNLPNLLDSYIPIHSIFTWAIYSLAMPTMTIAGCYFGYVDLDRKFKFIKFIVYIPCIILLFIYSPFEYVAYQLNDLMFWIINSLYNLFFGIIIFCMALKGIHVDKISLNEGSILKKKYNRRMREALVLLPPLYIWYLSIFPIHLLDVAGITILDNYLNVWELNLFLLIICVILAVLMSMNGDGFLGIRVVTTRYNYDFKMSSAEFMGNFSHRIKSETSYMNIRIDKIKEALFDNNGATISNEAIKNDINELSDKIEVLNNLSKKYSRYSNTINLIKKKCNLFDLINESLKYDYSIGVIIKLNIDSNISLVCDESLMIEVFKDIIENSVQAIQANIGNITDEPRIVISGMYDKGKVSISIKDNGIGIPLNQLNTIFDPGVTTKNKEFNSGMGLANCRKVIKEHRGSIIAINNDDDERGATVIINLPK